MVRRVPTLMHVFTTRLSHLTWASTVYASKLISVIKQCRQVTVSFLVLQTEDSVVVCSPSLQVGRWYWQRSNFILGWWKLEITYWNGDMICCCLFWTQSSIELRDVSFKQPAAAATTKPARLKAACGCLTFHGHLVFFPSTWIINHKRPI